jgi:hypothetical protein
MDVKRNNDGTNGWNGRNGKMNGMDGDCAEDNVIE